VAERAVRRRFNFWRSASISLRSRRYSSSTCAPGLTISTPSRPSTITSSPSRIMLRA
jgi:hypothetical protein